MRIPWKEAGMTYEAWCKIENTEKLKCSYCAGYSLVSKETLKSVESLGWKHRCQKCDVTSKPKR